MAEYHHYCSNAVCHQTNTVVCAVEAVHCLFFQKINHDTYVNFKPVQIGSNTDNISLYF